MSQPRVTVTVGRGGQRSATISSDRIFSEGSGGIIVNRKRSVKDRLGDGVGYTPPYVASNKRQCQEFTWKPRGFMDANAIRSSIHGLPHSRQDLRNKLNQKNYLKRRQSLNASTNLTNEVPEKVSLSSQSQGSRVLLNRHPIPVKSMPVIRPLPPAAAIASRIKAVQAPVAMAQPTVATLLQSLGLTKYSIMFQAEEVDMAALRNMTDDDLKELGLPMGPRKKILLALSRK